MMTGTTEKYALPLANASDTFDATDINVVTQAVEDTISGLEGAHDEDIENLNTELETTKGAVTEVSNNLGEAQTTLNASIAEASNQITELQTQLTQLQTDIQQAELNLQTLQTAMSTKAGINDANVFTKKQTALNGGILVKTDTDATSIAKPFIAFKDRTSNEAMLMHNGDNFVVGDFTKNYKLLDTSDIRLHTTNNYILTNNSITFPNGSKLIQNIDSGKFSVASVEVMLNNIYFIKITTNTSGIVVNGKYSPFKFLNGGYIINIYLYNFINSSMYSLIFKSYFINSEYNNNYLYFHNIGLEVPSTDLHFLVILVDK